MTSAEGGSFLYLPDSAIEALAIPPGEIADAIEAALIARSEGRLHVTPKSALLPGRGRYMMSTLAVGDEGLTVLKTVSVSPDNPGRGLPSINGAILALDAETGLLKAVMGANWITAHRTAALSAVAARRLADPASASVGFVGCGVQARSHLAAFRAQFPLQRVLACGRGTANRDAFCEEARALGLDARAADPEETLREADIVVTSITLDYAVEPFLDAAWMKPNAFAAITDLCIPWRPDSLARIGTVVIDDLEQERAAERPMVDARAVAGDLTDLVTGRVGEPTQPAAFAFRGMALGDHAAAALAYARACETGAGLVVADSALDSGT
ncbi:MAG: ornithine cyclodeaminase family protein [Boseongicola sp. SB0665_bin_10]|nr:ornithine cyclodeaminase family protein [Boseongicola sp. SB0665_bin_10]